MASAEVQEPVSKGYKPPGMTSNNNMITLKSYGRNHTRTAFYFVGNLLQKKKVRETLGTAIVREGLQQVQFINDTGDIVLIANGGLYSDNEEMEVRDQNRQHVASIANGSVSINHGQQSITCNYSTPNYLNSFAIYNLTDNQRQLHLASFALGDNRTCCIYEVDRIVSAIEFAMLVMLLVKMSYSIFLLHQQPMADGILSQLPPEIPPQPTLDSLENTGSLIFRNAVSDVHLETGLSVYYYELMDHISHKIQFIAKLENTGDSATISILDHFGSPVVTTNTFKAKGNKLILVYRPTQDMEHLGTVNVHTLECSSATNDLVMQGFRQKTDRPLSAKMTRKHPDKRFNAFVIIITSPIGSRLAQIYPEQHFNAVLTIFGREKLTKEQKALLLCLTVRHSAFEYKSTGQYGVDSTIYPFRRKAGHNV